MIFSDCLVGVIGRHIRYRFHARFDTIGSGDLRNKTSSATMECVQVTGHDC